jgi:hypothetical protein
MLCLLIFLECRIAIVFFTWKAGFSCEFMSQLDLTG